MGDMLELGKGEVEFHIQAGRRVAEMGWDLLITVGPLSMHMAEGALSSGMEKSQIVSFADSVSTAEGIFNLIQDGDLILIKASRRIEAEKIVEKLESMGS